MTVAIGRVLRIVFHLYQLSPMLPPSAQSCLLRSWGKLFPNIFKSSCCNVNVMHFKIHHFVSSSIDKSDPKKRKGRCFYWNTWSLQCFRKFFLSSIGYAIFIIFKLSCLFFVTKYGFFRFFFSFHNSGCLGFYCLLQFSDKCKFNPRDKVQQKMIIHWLCFYSFNSPNYSQKKSCNALRIDFFLFSAWLWWTFGIISNNSLSLLSLDEGFVMIYHQGEAGVGLWGIHDFQGKRRWNHSSPTEYKMGDYRKLTANCQWERIIGL